MLIGAISDTHGVWDQPFMDFLKDVDVIWHAGDWGSDIEFTKKISDWKPVIGVYGNCDGRDIRLDYPEHQFFECEGMKVLITHIGGYPGRYDYRAKALIEQLNPDIFMCGHSHILKVQYDHKYNMLDINPGACGIQGWHLVRTALRFKIERGELSGMEVFELNR